LKILEVAEKTKISATPPIIVAKQRNVGSCNAYNVVSLQHYVAVGHRCGSHERSAALWPPTCIVDFHLSNFRP
jgi:hypothetical protein